MKDKVIRIVEQLTQLNHPLSLETVSAIITPYQHLFSKQHSFDGDIAKCWKILSKLYLDYLTWMEASNQQAIADKLIQQQREVTTTLVSHECTVKNLAEQQQSAVVRIDELYPQALERFCEEMKANNPTQEVIAPSDDSGRYALTLSLHTHISDKQHKLLQENHRVEFTEDSNLQSRLLNSLKQLKVILGPSNDLQSITFMHAQLVSGKKKQIQLQEKLLEYQLQLQNSITASDISQRIDSINQSIEKKKKKLELKTKQLADFKLAQETKSVLEANYDAAENKASFIEEKIANNSNAKSWLNPESVVLWFTDHTSYETDIAKSDSELLYLRLLHKKNVSTQQIASLQKTLEQTQQLNPANVSQDQMLSPNDSIFIYNEIIHLLKTFDKSYISDQEVTAVSLLPDITRYLEFIKEKLSNLDQNISLFEQLIGAKTRLLHLRTQYKIFDNSYYISNPEVFAKLKANSTNRQAIIDQLTLDIDKVKELIILYRQYMDTKITIADLDKEIQKMRNKLFSITLSINNMEKENYQQSISDFQSKVEAAVTQLKKMDLKTCTDSTAHTSSDPNAATRNHLEDESSLTSSIDHGILSPHLNNLYEWNRKIQLHTTNLPEHLSVWYDTLFNALQQQLTDENVQLQMYQLLRDIHFELEYPLPEDQTSVLEQYRELCPDPEVDWQKLTQLKPAVPTDISDLTHYPVYVNQQFIQLNQQIVKLKSLYPREARLAAQASNNLLHLASTNDKSKVHPFTSCTVDPRYGSLHRHRGFFQVTEWLAELLTSILNLFSKEQQDYRNRFFFRKTESIRLLENTEHIISCNG